MIYYLSKAFWLVAQPGNFLVLLLALGCLFLSLRKRLKLLGQSSLLIFGASVFKVFLYDIAMAAPLIRIASLLVLGASLYLGGWLYKKVNGLEDDGVPGRAQAGLIR